MMQKKPMRTPPIPVGPGTGSRWTGWTKRLEDLVDQLVADVEGLTLRLRTGIGPGEPTCYRAEKTFAPEAASFLMDTEQDGVSSNLVNFILRDGVVYSVPIRMPGDGVFVPDHMRVMFRQRLFVPGFGNAIQLAGAPSHVLTRQNAVVQWPWTTKFSLLSVQPEARTGRPVAQPCAVNFFWNVLDPRSGRKLADDWVSNIMLLPGSPYSGLSLNLHPLPPIVDGGFFRFDCPWLHERDSNLELQIRPINPVVQFDSSIDGAATPLAFDDREQGVRDQSVTVAIEIHGHRYRTDQDAMRAGALTRY